MLSRLHIQGWRSLADVDLKMKPLNVLIGPNGSGKSNTLDIFKFMFEASRGNLLEGIMSRGGWNEVKFKKKTEDSITFEFEFEDNGDFRQEGGITYYLGLEKKGFYPVVGCEKITKPPKGDHLDPFEIIYRDKRVCKFQNAIRHGKDDLKEILDESQLAIFQYQDQKFYPTPNKLLKQLNNWIYYTLLKACFR